MYLITKGKFNSSLVKLEGSESTEKSIFVLFTDCGEETQHQEPFRHYDVDGIYLSEFFVTP